MEAQAEGRRRVLLGSQKHQQEQAIHEVSENDKVGECSVGARRGRFAVDGKSHRQHSAGTCQHTLPALRLRSDGARAAPVKKRMTDYPGMHRSCSPELARPSGA